MLELYRSDVDDAAATASAETVQKQCRVDGKFHVDIVQNVGQRHVKWPTNTPPETVKNASKIIAPQSTTGCDAERPASLSRSSESDAQIDELMDQIAQKYRQITGLQTQNCQSQNEAKCRLCFVPIPMPVPVLVPVSTDFILKHFGTNEPIRNRKLDLFHHSFTIRFSHPPTRLTTESLSRPSQFQLTFEKMGGHDHGHPVHRRCRRRRRLTCSSFFSAEAKKDPSINSLDWAEL
uniref:Uncharacterized protein n=1 Tax=Globodera rostochiensis TaxID=31243 RepID=A0A914IFQ6_GLORO